MCPEVSKVLVTGASGFVGAALCRDLVTRGLSVSGVVRRIESCPDGVVPVVVKDIADLDSWQWSSMLEQFDVVVHCAALTHHHGVEDGRVEEAFHRVNVSATLALAKAAADAGVSRFVFLSTVKVLGEETFPGSPFTPESIAAPSGVYATSKWNAELGLASFVSGCAMDLVIIRPPLVYGSGAKGNFDLLESLIKRKFPLPLASVSNLRSMVSIDNLVDLISICVMSPEPIRRTLLVSDDDDVSTPALITRLADAIDVKPVLFPMPPRVLRLLATLTGQVGVVTRLCGSLQVDISETKKLLGWQPRLGMDQAFMKMM